MLTRRDVLLLSTALALPCAVRAADDPTSLVVSVSKTPDVAATPEPASESFAYNGTRPGPVLRLKRGVATPIRVESDAAAPPRLALHGARILDVPSNIAGVVSGVTVIPPDAGTYIYRPPIGPGTADLVRTGLSGILIVEDEPTIGVPSEIVLGVSGGAGSWQVNGSTAVEIDTVPGDVWRVRIANLCADEGLPLLLDGNSMQIVAWDGRYVNEAFAPSTDPVFLLPGSRMDVIVTAPLAAQTATIMAIGDEAPVTLLSLRSGQKTSVETARVPFSVPANISLPTAIDLAAATRLALALGKAGDRYTINDVSGDWASRPPIAIIAKGSPVVVAITNTTDTLQALHFAGQAMRQLFSLDDGWEPWWIDTVMVQPAETISVAFIADIPGLWPIASAFLSRAEAGLVTWLDVK